MKAIVPCSSLKMDCPCKLEFWELCGVHCCERVGCLVYILCCLVTSVTEYLKQRWSGVPFPSQFLNLIPRHSQARWISFIDPCVITTVRCTENVLFFSDCVYIYRHSENACCSTVSILCQTIILKNTRHNQSLNRKTPPLTIRIMTFRT